MEDVLISRMTPAGDPLRDFFWQSGSDGRLRFLRCSRCGYYSHPPTTRCPRCLDSAMSPQPVSGLGRVHTFTVNIQRWVEAQDPYTIAVVELDDQEGLRLTTNIVGCRPDEVFIGLAVEVRFLHRHGLWYPLFAPVPTAATATPSGAS